MNSIAVVGAQELVLEVVAGLFLLFDLELTIHYCGGFVNLL